MRYISVQQFIIDTQLPQMFCGDRQIDIEPKLHQLLLYFCHHPNCIITRDQIIEEVNQGVIVSDNAINKMVANIRQLLGDDAKNPEFIKTIPRRGYCFIAIVESRAEVKAVIENKDISIQQPSGKNNQSKTTRIVLTFCTIFALLLAFILIFQLEFNTRNKPEQLKGLIPLTRHSGVEFSPAISPDQKYLIYTRNDPANNITQLWLKTLKGNKPEQLLSNLTSDIKSAWSPNSKRFVFVEYNEGNCQFKSLEFPLAMDNKMNITTIADCDASYVPKLLFVNDSHTLYYIGRKNDLAPMKVLSFNLADKSRQLIKQPLPSNYGNYYIDLSKNGKKLLILTSEDKAQSTLHQLDLENNQLTPHGTWPRFLRSMIWHHDNQSVVHTSNEFSHELIHSDVRGNKLRTLVSTSNRVAENFSRHPNEKDFYFTSFMMNNDNVLFDLTDNKKYQNFNSAVYDKTPIFGASTNHWYFVSKRNGIHQIFSALENTQQVTQISQFKSEPSIDSMDISPDGKQLVWANAGSFTIKDLATKESINTEITSGTILAAQWLSNDEISVSVQRNNFSQLYLYNVATRSLSKEEIKWQAAFASPSGLRKFRIESLTRRIFELKKLTNTFIDTGITIPQIYGRNGLNVRATETALIYATQDSNINELMQYTFNDKQLKTLGKWLFISGFDALEQRILVSYEQSRSGDIMMTQF